MSVSKRFHANIRKTDLPMVNLRWNVTQKLDPTLEPSDYKRPPKIRMFSAENSICPRRFIRDGPELLHTCSTCMSIPRPYYIRRVLFIFAEYIWSYVVRTYTCIHVSKKSAESKTNLGAAHLGQSASFIAAFHWIDDKSRRTQHFHVLRPQYVRIRAYMSRRRVPNHKPVWELHT